MKNQKRKKILYISYDGILDPIGESQILSYLEKLCKDFDFYLITFEKKNKLKTNVHREIKARVKQSDIKWFNLRYHKQPPILSTLYNVFRGTIITFFILFFNKISIVHVRSYIPGLITLPINKIFDFKLIFDMRGLWVDEKLDRAGWRKKDLKYIFFKNIEKKLLLISDSIICLTQESIKILIDKFPEIKRKNIYKTFTCSNDQIFKPLHNKRINQSIVLGHLGSVDTAYNIEIIFQFLNILLKIDQNIKLIIFNEDKHDYLFELKKKYQINDKNIEVKFVNRYQLNTEINKIDICIFFAKINFSIKASFPTKISEVLSAGKPIICNNFNDEILKLFSKHKVGIIHDFDFSKNQSIIYYEINNLISDENIILRCRNVAKKELSFSQSIKLYKNIYYN
jgi:glycosyltransferase involved in cell wall biosynthesis|tara:strand:+ start:254 stop:1444 length:1191 start_codon:yes stop_codon:yes gene_type:complete